MVSQWKSTRSNSDHRTWIDLTHLNSSGNIASYSIMKNFSRRDFLKISTNSLLALAGLLGFGELIRYLSYQYDPAPPSEFDIGPAVNYPLDSHTILAHIPAILIHDKKGLRAINLACTHL